MRHSVIAFNRGSVPEVIEHGVTGYIVDDVQGAVEALTQLDALSRPVVREHFVKRFSSELMAHHYLDVYTTLVQGAKRPQLCRVVTG